MLSSDQQAVKRPEILAYRRPPPTGEFVSNVLERICQELIAGEQKIRILDLGACCRDTFESFSAPRCVISFEDLGREAALSDPAAREDWRISESLSSLPAARPLDLVLCWDVLNYLHQDEIADLFRLFAASMSRETRIYALLSTLLQSPSRPGDFSLHGGKQVRYLLPVNDLIPCPRYSPRDLEKLLPYFRLERVTLLQNGYYEIVFMLAE